MSRTWIRSEAGCGKEFVTHISRTDRRAIRSRAPREKIPWTAASRLVQGNQPGVREVPSGPRSVGPDRAAMIAAINDAGPAPRTRGVRPVRVCRPGTAWR